MQSACVQCYFNQRRKGTPRGPRGYGPPKLLMIMRGTRVQASNSGGACAASSLGTSLPPHSVGPRAKAMLGGALGTPMCSLMRTRSALSVIDAITRIWSPKIRHGNGNTSSMQAISNSPEPVKARRLRAARAALRRAAFSSIPAPKQNGPEGPFVLSVRHHRSGGRFLRVLHVLLNLVKVQVFVDRRAVLVHDAHGFVVLGHGGDLAKLRRDRGQFG